MLSIYDIFPAGGEWMPGDITQTVIQFASKSFLVGIELSMPFFVIPARFMGRKLQSITREGYGLNASMNTTMTERFNVAGALLVKLFSDS